MALTDWWIIIGIESTQSSKDFGSHMYIQSITGNRNPSWLVMNSKLDNENRL